MPWIARRDYLAHRALDWTLPGSFEEWEELAEAKAGPRRGKKRVVIQASEFSRWCIGEGREPDEAARTAFALHATRRMMPSR